MRIEIVATFLMMYGALVWAIWYSFDDPQSPPRNSKRIQRLMRRRP